MTEEYFVPTRKQRIRLVVWIFLAIVFSIIIKPSIHLYISFISEKSLCEQVLWWRYSLGILFLIGFIIIYRLVKTGYLLLIHKQLPLPGTIHLFRTKIVRGWRVRIEALVSLVLAFVIFLGLIHLARTDFIVEFFTTQCIGA